MRVPDNYKKIPAGDGMLEMWLRSSVTGFSRFVKKIRPAGVAHHMCPKDYRKRVPTDI